MRSALLNWWRRTFSGGGVEPQSRAKEDAAAPGGGPSGGSAQAPDIAGASPSEPIRPVDLSLHSDGIDHWQDEPQGTVEDDDGKREVDAAKPRSRRSDRNRS
ncbi:hypothetical protein [Nitratireductor thuwali]|uniref:hypothetical protein n=1 Tax=Nitratireductor thuwali TaxID=2267699 RepID=UPI0030D40C0E